MAIITDDETIDEASFTLELITSAAEKAFSELANANTALEKARKEVKEVQSAIASQRDVVLALQIEPIPSEIRAQWDALLKLDTAPPPWWRALEKEVNKSLDGLDTAAVDLSKAQEEVETLWVSTEISKLSKQAENRAVESRIKVVFSWHNGSEVFLDQLWV